MDIAIKLFAGMYENETFHDEDQQEAGQNRQAEVGTEQITDLGQHMKKHRAEQDASAKTEQ